MGHENWVNNLLQSHLLPFGANVQLSVDGRDVIELYLSLSVAYFERRRHKFIIDSQIGCKGLRE